LIIELTLALDVDEYKLRKQYQGDPRNLQRIIIDTLEEELKEQLDIKVIIAEAK